MGDYVFGQAGMGNILQQLLEQAQNAAPGAQAARDDIVRELPRLKVTAELLGRSLSFSEREKQGRDGEQMKKRRGSHT